MRRVLGALFLAVQACAASAAQPAAPDVAPESGTITITAPREREKALKRTQAGGTAVAAGGLGAMGYIVFAAPTGPLGWAAAAVLLGGMSAYLAHRKLKGHDDFSPAAVSGGGGAARAGPMPTSGR